MIFNPDWQLTLPEEVAVALSLSLHKHVPGWGGATDEQLESVALDIIAAIRARGETT